MFYKGFRILLWPPPNTSSRQHDHHPCFAYALIVRDTRQFHRAQPPGSRHELHTSRINKNYSEEECTKMPLCSSHLNLVLAFLSQFLIAPHHHALGFVATPATLSQLRAPLSGSQYHGTPANRRLCKNSGLNMVSSPAKPSSAADKLRDLLSKPEILTMPCCYDGLTARLVEDAGFPLTFMTGFGVSGAHGLPDTQVRPGFVLRFFL